MSKYQAYPYLNDFGIYIWPPREGSRDYEALYPEIKENSDYDGRMVYKAINFRQFKYYANDGYNFTPWGFIIIAGGTHTVYGFETSTDHRKYVEWLTRTQKDRIGKVRGYWTRVLESHERNAAHCRPEIKKYNDYYSDWIRDVLDSMDERYMNLERLIVK